MEERKISIFCRKAVRLLGILMIGYLFLQGLFTICCIQRVTDRTYYVLRLPIPKMGFAP